MDESKERAVVAFTTVFAHSEHWRGAYVPLAAEQARIAADNVACATIGVPPGLLLATVREMAGRFTMRPRCACGGVRYLQERWGAAP